MLNENRIKEHLQQHWDTLNTRGIRDNQIVGVFLYGSQNYNFATDDSDIDTKAIIVPNIEDICTKPEWMSVTYACNSKEVCDAKDIREMRNQWKKQNINFVETLFTDYYILNPRYTTAFNTYFRDNAELIAHYNQTQTVKSICGQILHTLHESNNIDNKKLYNCHRLLYFLNKYLDEQPYRQCIRPAGTEWINLWKLKYGESELSRSKPQKQADARSLEIATQELLDNVTSYNVNTQAEVEMDKGVEEIICINLGDLRRSTTSAEGFKSILTNQEKQTYQYLITQIHEEGRIHMNAIAKGIGVSPAVVASLLNKMEQKQVAKIQRGNTSSRQGTLITITEPELRQEAIHAR